MSSDTHGTANRRRRQSRKWWQWLLLYPTLTVALIGAVPQYTNVAKAYVYNVPVKQVFSAEMQNELWNKNADCLLAAHPAQVAIQEHILVSVSACASRDVLVGIRYPGDKDLYRWIPFATLESPDNQMSLLEIARPSKDPMLNRLKVKGAGSNAGASNFLFSEGNVFPGETPSSISEGQTQSDRKVICQRWLPDGRLLRRIRESDKNCFDEIVNTYTGKVEETKPAECSPNCG